VDYRTPNIYDPSTLTEPYAYARGNPTMFWDPDGLMEIPYRIGNTNYILHIDDETWSAILHGELTFGGITLFDPLAPVTPAWTMHHSVDEDFPDMEMTNREKVWHYQKELMSREAKQLAFIQAFMPRQSNTVFPWILNDVLKSLNESDAQGRGAIYRALYQVGMLHQVNVANGFGRDYAQEAALALVGPQIEHYKKFGFWQDFEVAGWLFTAGEAGWILKGLIRPIRSLLTRSFDDLLPVAANNAAETLTHRNGVYEVITAQPISGMTRSAHRAAANRALLEAVESDPQFARQLGEILGVDDVAAHMRSGRSGLRNPPSTEWHHPIDNPEVMQLLRRQVHRHPELQDILHSGPNRTGGFGQHFGGGE
jgi:hypothetical protein